MIFCKFQEFIRYIPVFYEFSSRIQWNLSITDTLEPDIFGHFLLQYRGFPLSEVKNVFVTPVGTKIFVIFSIVSLIWRVC